MLPVSHPTRIERDRKRVIRPLLFHPDTASSAPISPPPNTGTSTTPSPNKRRKPSARAVPPSTVSFLFFPTSASFPNQKVHTQSSPPPFSISTPKRRNCSKTKTRSRPSSERCSTCVYGATPRSVFISLLPENPPHSPRHNNTVRKIKDLSLLTNMTHDDIQRLQTVSKEEQAERAKYILLDDGEQAWAQLRASHDRVDIVLDNGPSSPNPPFSPPSISR